MFNSSQNLFLHGTNKTHYIHTDGGSLNIQKLISSDMYYGGTWTVKTFIDKKMPELKATMTNEAYEYLNGMVSCLQDNWMIFDNKREGYNVDNDVLLANNTTVESTTDYIDILSNGLKLRSADGAVNSAGSTYVFAAFAEAPFVNSNGVPCNAR